MEDNTRNFDLVIAIVNKGYTDLVMQASRDAGARGGTIMTARGTGNREIGDFYGIAIQPEKEIVFILAKKEITDKVLEAIYKAAGLSTNGQGIAFAIPAGQTAGLTAQLLNSNNEENLKPSEKEPHEWYNEAEAKIKKD